MTRLSIIFYYAILLVLLVEVYSKPKVHIIINMYRKSSKHTTSLSQWEKGIHNSMEIPVYIFIVFCLGCTAILYPAFPRAVYLKERSCLLLLCLRFSSPYANTFIFFLKKSPTSDPDRVLKSVFLYRCPCMKYLT